jgi:hypothetical protein
MVEGKCEEVIGDGVAWGVENSGGENGGEFYGEDVNM